MKVFVSYRRSDSRDVAARIADRLADQPGISEVFFDVEDIEPGADFRQRIDHALSNSQVALVLIGPDWTGAATDDGRTRILRPDDFVRYEVSAALRSGERVIPVLLNDAQMPSAEDLPDDVRGITTKNAVFIRHTSFNQDMALLVEALTMRRPGGRARHWLRRHPLLTRLAGALAGMAGAAIGLLGVAIVHAQLTGGRALEQTLGGAGMVWLVIAVVLLVGAALPLWWLRRR